MCHLRQLFPCWYFLSGRSIHWCLWNVKYPYNDCITFDLSIYVYQDLLYIFRCSYVGCINVYKGYKLLLNCSLYHYVVSFLVSYYGLCFKVYFVRYTYCYPSFFFPFHLHEIYFSIILLLVCVYLVLRWVSHRQAYIWVLFSYPFSYPMSFDWNI